MAEIVIDDKSKEPYEPSAEEKELYYYGIAGNPKLVARTSWDLWVKPQHRLLGWVTRVTQTSKHFGVIRDEDDIVSKWTRDLSKMIVDVLEPYPWSYFFPVRMPLEPAEDLIPSPTERKAIEEAQPIILLIAVTENSMGWKRGIEMALRCRELLRDHGLAIEVEVREGTRQRNAISADLESQIDETFWSKSPVFDAWNPNGTILPMLSYSGYPVGYLKDYFSWGTIGMHVVLEDDSKVYGLTCRHVVDGGQPLEKKYNVSTENQKQHHIHGTNRIVIDTLEELETLHGCISNVLLDLNKKKELWDLFYHTDPDQYHDRRCPTELEEKQILALEARRSYNQELIESLEKVKASANSERVIGHVAFYPSFEVSTRTPGYLKDWALIELDKHKYPKGFKNKVYINDIPRKETGFEKSDGQLLCLQPQQQERGDTVVKKSFVVAKRGAASNLTFGMISAIEAVVREPKDDGKHYICWELLIAPLGGKGKFSTNGDSGSCIFDKNGQVIGMVVGSNQVNVPDNTPWRGIASVDGDPRVLKKHSGGQVAPEKAVDSKGKMGQWDDATDITFAAPIDWIFDDIQDLTGFKPRLV
ncbi:hypothetical protein F4801DRAFT_583133 [Xylaria longipes]|nr:hypothetical protein F4801DRAFT_583133 [Xylaria longipes]